MTEAAEQGVSVEAGVTENSFKVPNTMADPAPTDQKTFELSDIIPDSYKDKTWVSKYNNIDDFFKGMDGMQEMLGKRPAGIPHENASPEEWSDFYNQLGRPKDPNDYKIDTPQDLPDGLKVNDEQRQEFTKLAHELGLTQKQVEKLAEYDLKTKQATLEASKPDLEKIDQEFNEFAQKTWGDREKEALDGAAKLLAKHAPQEMQEHIQQLDNKSLIALTSVLDSVTQTYLKEGQTHNNGGDAPIGPTKDDMHKEKNELMRSPAFKNAFHVDHDRTKTRVEELAQKLYGDG